MKKAILFSFAIFISFWAVYIIPDRIAEAPIQTIEPVAVVDSRPELIDGYFRQRHMSLAGEGKNFVAAADREEIDYRLLAAISVRESSGGLHMPYESFNAWGWNSGDYSFQSFKDAIDFISGKLSHGSAYAGKNLREKLETYNPPNVLATYADEVMEIMAAIGPEK